MKWEPNIVGYPISEYRISVWQNHGSRPRTNDVRVEPVTARPTMDLSDNILLAHYQRDRR